MHARRKCGSKLLARQNRAQRQPGGERLRHRHHVGKGRESLITEVPPGPAKPALNFVRDQRRAVPSGQRPRRLPKFLAHGEDSAFALNGLDYDSHTASSNFASRSAVSLNRTNSTPGTNGAKGSRYFAVCVIESAPNVRP